MSRIDIPALTALAKQGSRTLSTWSTQQKNEILLAMAHDIREAAQSIAAENAKDIEAGDKAGLSAAMLDRLLLNAERIEACAKGLEEIAALPDPVGNILSHHETANHLKIDKVSVPIGVIGIIYESRPNVTVDVIGLCLKSGNAVVLKGGKEAIHSNRVLVHVLKGTLQTLGYDDRSIQFVDSVERKATQVLLKQNETVDLIIPRGGKGLIEAVIEHSTIPVLKHLNGVCHVYVDAKADLEMAAKIVVNAKCQRPGVCNALETLLVHEDVAPVFLPDMVRLLEDQGVELRGCEQTRAMVPSMKEATEEDWREEYLDLILSIRVVPHLDAAIEHIQTYGSSHSDAIVTEDAQAAEKFLNEVDSCTVYHNASTRFTDGAVFGKGAEMGISTDKLHARGPVGLEELTIYKYKVYGAGQVRG